MAVAVAAITLLSGGVSAAGSSPHLGTLAHRAGPTVSPAPNPVSSASASLARGEGPAAAHPLSLPISPGGYSWTNISSALTGAPSGRLTSMAWDASDGYVVLFGWVTIGGSLRDTWSYANGTWTNLSSMVSASPPFSPYAVMTYEPSIQKVVMYAGENNSTWTYHDKVWTNVTSTSGSHPPSLILESFVTDTFDNEAVLIGGQALYGPAFPHVTWTYKNGAWTNITSTAPFNFGRIVLPIGADDPMGHGILAFALSEWQNTTPFLYRPSTFQFSGGTWTNLTPTLPQEPPMGEAQSFNYLPSISADVLMEPIVVNSTGQLGSHSGVTWEYAGGVWTNVTAVTGPQPDTGVLVSSAADPTDGTILMFGGERLTPPVVYPGSWLFSAPPKVTATASKTSLDSGQSVALTGTTSGGASPTTIRWTLGDGSSASALSTSHTYTQTGVVTATLTVTDLVGHNSSASVSFVVNPALAVTANASPASPVNGTWVALTSHVTGGTAPYTYSWALGDSHTSSESSLAHVYALKGTYVANLTVTDSAGVSVSTAVTVVVQAAAAPPPPPTTTSNSVSLSSGTGLYLLIGIILLLIIVVVLAAMLAMRPRSPPGAPTPYMATSPPPPGPSPPPGAGGSPPS